MGNKQVLIVVAVAVVGALILVASVGHLSSQIVEAPDVVPPQADPDRKADVTIVVTGKRPTN
jgi:hypothetical protein